MGMKGKPAPSEREQLGPKGKQNLSLFQFESSINLPRSLICLFRFRGTVASVLNHLLEMFTTKNIYL